MTPSCCAWALSGADVEILEALAGLGLGAVDVRPSMLRGAAARSDLRRLSLDVTCVAASHQMPAGASLVAGDPVQVEAACRHVEDALAHAAGLGARRAYVVPEAAAAGGPGAYAEPLARLADHGAGLGVGLCVEHFPGTAFPTVAATLEFLAGLAHPNLYLLFDIGHAQMSGEDPRGVLAAAGDRLGYVHLDDNDARNDLHLALTDGVQTEASLGALLAALAEVGYGGPVSLEMKADLPDPLDAIGRSADLLRHLLGQA